MNFNDYPEVSSAAPGVLGSLFSMLWINDTWPRKLVMFFAGAALARLGTHDVARISGLNDGLIGFLLGLFGMAITASVFAGWAKLDMSVILRDALRQVLRLPPKES